MANEQHGFYVDTTRCIKCWACLIACKQWNGIDAGTISRRKVAETNTGSFPNVTRTFTSTSCMHCATPACLATCPADAISKREEDGVVVVDRELCIGCERCSDHCPFDVPEFSFDEESGGLRLNKCDTCLGIGRKAGEDTHCVATCPMGALHFGSLSELAELAAKKNGKLMEGETGPSVYVS